MLGLEVPQKVSAEEKGCCSGPSRWSGRWGEVRRGGQRLAVGANAATAQRPHPCQMWLRLRLGRPTLLGNWSPGRRETLSQRPQPTGLTEIPGPMAQKPISTAAAERMNFVTQDRIW